jgi:hypothetical protein
VALTWAAAKVAAFSVDDWDAAVLACVRARSRCIAKSVLVYGKGMLEP